MNNKNNPKVKKVIGSVNNTKIGLTKIFNNASTTATLSDVSIPLSNRTPFIKLAISITNIVVIISLNISFIIIDLKNELFFAKTFVGFPHVANARHLELFPMYILENDVLFEANLHLKHK